LSEQAEAMGPRL